MHCRRIREKEKKRKNVKKIEKIGNKFGKSIWILRKKLKKLICVLICVYVYIKLK